MSRSHRDRPYKAVLAHSPSYDTNQMHFFSAQTHVCLISARSDGPDHADSLKYNIFVPCEPQLTCHLQRWDVYLDSGFLSPKYAAVCCRRALGACTNVEKVVNLHSF